MNKALTVRELVAALSKYDDDTPVWAEGCDCTNPVAGTETWDGRVFININLR